VFRHPAVVFFEGALLATLLLAPSRRTRLLVLAALAGLLLSLVSQSTPRQVGDTGEYVVMSLNLSHFSRPSLTSEDLAAARGLFPGDAGVRLEMPQLRAPDDRQDFPHFWFYSLLAAPFVRLTHATGGNPISGFAVLNVVLLLGVAALLVSRASVAVALFVVAGPILWWIDKAHTEVFTLALLTVALLFLRSAPWWSIVALGAAATQNPPIGVAMGIAVALALYKVGWRDRRVWIATAVGVAVAALHPLYYHARLAVWTGLFQSVDYHWPSIRELITVPFDPNLGIFVHDPIVAIVMVIAFAEAVTRPTRARFDATDSAIVLIAVLFLVSFTQTTNFNSGGTPDPSRYGLWLIPFVVPILGGIPAAARWPRALAAASVVWCVWAFPPDLPDQNLRPTTLAADLWTRWPEIDNPIAEIFAERIAGHEPARPPLATSGCEKILLMGTGADAPWPASCGAHDTPGFCKQKDAVCYANRVGDAYRFVSAPSSPAWRIGVTRTTPARLPQPGMLTITQTAEPRLPMAFWQEEGWSYPERLTVPTTDVYAREWRWIAESARVGVMTSAPVTARLKIAARAFNKSRRVKVAIGGMAVATLLVAESRAEYQTPPFEVPEGTSFITLESLDGAEPPATGDPRRLSVAVFHMELVAEKK
jgi:hypothetical protein